MSTDDRISADLANVARASRSRPRPLATTLRELGAHPQPPDPDRSVRASLAFAPIYAARLARIIAGSAFLVVVVAHVVFFAFGHIDREQYENGSLIVFYVEQSYGDLALSLGAMTALIYIVVWRIALYRSERDGRREQADRLERLSVAIGVAAPMAFILFFGLLRVVLGSHGLDHIVQSVDGYEGPLWWQRQCEWTNRALACALAATSIGAIVASRSRKPRRWLAVLAGLALTVTVFVGLRYDEGPLRDAMTSSMVPSVTERTVLLAIGGTSLLALVSTFALARRRREIAALDGK